MFVIILLFIIFIIILSNIKRSGSFEKDIYKKLWYIYSSLKNTDNIKKYKEIYLYSYYSNQNIYDAINKENFKYENKNFYKESYIPQNMIYDDIDKNINLKYLSWPTLEWTVTPDFIKELYNFYIFDKKIQMDFLNLNHLNIVDLFSNIYSKSFWYYCCTDPLDIEKKYGSLGFWQDFLNQNSDKDLFCMVPKNIDICKTFVKLIENRKTKIFICVHENYLQYMPKYDIKKKINKLYSVKHKIFKTTEKYWGLFIN